MCTVLVDTIGIMARKKVSKSGSRGRGFTTRQIRLHPPKQFKTRVWKSFDPVENRIDLKLENYWAPDKESPLRSYRRVKREIVRELPTPANLFYTSRLHQGLMEKGGLYRDYVCAKRKVRREVLHALRLTGSGPRSRPRYNESSQVKC